MTPRLLLTLCVFSLAAAAVGQSGRSMRLHAPAVIGQTARFAMQHPVAAAGNLYGLVWSPPFANAVPLSLPQLTVNGLVRVDLANAITASSGVLGNSGMTPDLSLPIPNDPLLVGYAWDLQGVDLSPANVVTLADDDLAIVVSAPPLPTSGMVGIAPGTFLMGSPVTPLVQLPYVNRATTQPVHQVLLTQPIWIGTYEVTQGEYQAVMGANPSRFQGPFYPPNPNRPVEQVSWHDAMAYCSALTALEAAAGRLPSGYQYRLPTEAEWEYCCRAGTTTEFHYGPILDCQDANFWHSFHSNTTCGGTSTVGVGGYAPNAWGLFDMHGNVWEWCLDAWDGSANYPSSAVADPFVPGSGSRPYRVTRGGGWIYYSSNCRSANREGSLPDRQDYDLGFRVVLAPILTP